jgi:1,4-dihydroxy-2-naphthoate polyprenyltransferase
MSNEESKHIEQEEEPKKPDHASHIVMAESVRAEQVPTIPIESLETISSLQPEVSVQSMESTGSVRIPEPLVAQPEEYRRTLKDWIQIWRDGIRLYYLPLSLMSVIVGSVLAWTSTVNVHAPSGHFHLSRFIGVVIAAICLHIGANLINDYYDYLRGADTGNVLGPGGLIQQGLIKPTRVLTFGLTAIGLGTLLSVLLSISGGPIVLLFSLLLALGTYFFSATRFALSTIMLGELACFVIFGPLLTIGAYMIQAGGQFTSLTFVYSVPLGLLAAAAVVVNNLRDFEDDENARKRTLVSALGIGWSRVLYVLFLVAAYLLIAFAGVPHGTPHLILITFWTLPALVVPVSGVLRSTTPAALHVAMRQTIRVETGFAILLSVGLIVTAFIPVLQQIVAKLVHF